MVIKSEKILIVGPAGSGKDFLLRGLAKEGLKTSIKYTTRPQRKYESNGIEYNFISESEFQTIDFIVSQNFTNSEGANWKYGISQNDFSESQAFIMTPGEISQLDPIIRKSCFVVYLAIDRKVRENRLQIRDDNNDSIHRRLDSDDVDFKNFKDYDLRIGDPEFEIESILQLMN